MPHSSVHVQFITRCSCVVIMIIIIFFSVSNRRIAKIQLHNPLLRRLFRSKLVNFVNWSYVDNIQFDIASNASKCSWNKKETREKQNKKNNNTETINTRQPRTYVVAVRIHNARFPDISAIWNSYWYFFCFNFAFSTTRFYYYLYIWLFGASSIVMRCVCMCSYVYYNFRRSANRETK